jgi:mRNA-degrading endonuclease toxin of MazEF toxin-antitoxin module
MCEQIKSIDFRARKARRIGPAPREFLDAVLSVIDACLYPKSEGA